MTIIRRVRGLVGTALTWGGVGALVGVGAFLAVFRPWPVNASTWVRTMELFVKWEGASVVWGVASGLAFGLVILMLERSRHWPQLSSARISAWGALAGGLFPALLSVGPLLGGASATYFGLIVGASTLAGAAWARASFAIARRAPDQRDLTMLARATAESPLNTVHAGRERVT
jgi:hypothetical protein